MTATITAVTSSPDGVTVTVSIVSGEVEHQVAFTTNSPDDKWLVEQVKATVQNLAQNEKIAAMFEVGQKIL